MEKSQKSNTAISAKIDQTKRKKIENKKERRGIMQRFTGAENGTDSKKNHFKADFYIN